MSKYAKIGVKTNGTEQNFEDYWPMHNGIVLKPHQVQNETNTGLYIPEEAKANANAMVEDDLAYEVLKVGPETVNVKPGDYVFTSMQTHYPVRLKGGPLGGNELYWQTFENLIVGLLRKDAKEEDFKDSKAIVEMSTKGLKMAK